MTQRGEPGSSSPVERIDDRDVRAAAHLIGRLDRHPLRTLDAVHLTVCTSRGIERLATAD